MFHNKKIQRGVALSYIFANPLSVRLPRKTARFSDVFLQSLCCGITHHVDRKTPLSTRGRMSEKGK